MEQNRAKILNPAKLRHLLRVTEATSRFPERDTLILLLGITCGMRVTEIARLEVHHVLSKSDVRVTSWTDTADPPECGQTVQKCGQRLLLSTRSQSDLHIRWCAARVGRTREHTCCTSLDTKAMLRRRWFRSWSMS